MRKIPFIVISILFFHAAHAQQPSAAFTADNVSGCAPLTVKFTDQSTGAPTNWNWDFGNGQLLTNQNNTITYTQPGIYSVKLVVRNANGINSTTKTNFIEVKAAPVVDFIVNKVSGCSNASFHFTDQSTVAGSTINSWLWDFGDGQIDNTNSPDHIYAAEGVYNVTLTVGTSAGCSTTLTKFNFLQVVPGIKADFSNTNPVSCSAPFQVVYTNLSTGQGTISYAWDLGNGTSTAASPTRNYNTAGNYTIKLVTKSSFGCSDSISKTISIKKVTTNFTFANTCISNATAFQNASDDVPVASLWTFGNAGQSVDINPSITFPSTGTYPVKLVNTYAGCKDSVTKNVIIQNNPVPNFTAGATVSCNAPFSVNFQSTSPGATGWTWDFGDGSAAGTIKNPTHVYSAAGKFSVSLTVSTSGGCTGTVSKQDFVNITQPTVNISNAPGGGCAPFNYSPIANITSVDGISNYSWNFGQGPIQNGAAPSHIYNTTGTYPLTLTITTNGGCQKTFNSTVSVGNAATAVDFTAIPLVVCPTINDQFNGTSATPNLTWDWTFGDGQTGSGQNPTHAYKDTGFFNVTVGATNNGCRITKTKNKYIEVLPPIADFGFSVDCNSGTQVTFTDKSATNAAAGTLTYAWDFGDPSVATSTDASPQINFSGPGTYIVKLTVSSANTTCSNSITKTVIISAPGADFTVDKTQICKDATFTLTSSSDPATITSYMWTIGTNAPVTAGAVYPASISTNGVYDVKLSLTDVNGCPHENLQPALLTISGPAAGFKNIAVHCGKDPITFTDSSASVTNITSWQYDFGDGNIQTFTSAPFTHQYADTGTYNISLLVTDAATCSNTFNQITALTISDPAAYFRQDSAVWCPGAPVIFTDSSSGNALSYLWNFGDGNTATDKNPTHIYSATDNDYTISLKVTDNAGCADSISREKFIRIKTPVAAFDVKTKSSICSPLIEEFTFKGSGYQTLTWNLGDGTPLLAQFTPTHAYTAFGNFTAVLTVSGNGGCSATASANINITDPATTAFNYIAPETCNRLTVNFNTTPPPSTKFSLFFGDGTADSSQSNSVAHTYTTPAFYQPYLVIKDSTGCMMNMNGPTVVRIIGAAPIFGTDPTERCDPGTVNFTNYTFSNDPVIKYNWNFGDNTTDGAFNTSHLYSNPGTYTPSLTVTTQRGCSSTLSDTVKIYRSPAVSIISNDTVCLNSAVKFSTSILSTDTAVSYAWSFSDGENSIKAEPAKTFRTIGSVVVTLQTSIPYGCISNTSKPINITGLPTVGPMADQTIMAGQTVILPAIYSDKVSKYLWSPDNSLNCSDCPNPAASPKNNTTYSVIATDRYGCEANGDITVLVTCNNNNFFIPNTFSPNNDGVNDSFYPRGTGLVRVAALRIFNRWGELVFEKKDFAANDARAGWDGTYKGKPAVSDVYIYKIEVICENSQIIPFQGNIFLLR